MPRTLIACGANLGDRKQTLTRAIELLAADPSIGALASSGFHETAPVGGPSDQPAFLNAAVRFDTTLSPQQLLELLLRVESDLGRQRAERWGPRAIDLDVLLYDEQVLHTPGLEIPHPRMTFRRFVLEPAAQIAADWVHPLTRWTIGRLLAHLQTAANYVALLGPPAAGKTELARAAAAAVGGNYVPDPIEASRTGADPSGHELQRQIQFLDRAPTLAAAGLEAGRGRVAISDFFFDQCLAYARVALEEADYRRFHRTWAQAREAVVQPKLLVVLDDWQAMPTASAPGDWQRTDENILRRELLRQAVDKGPVLFAGREKTPERLEELTAAIAAMQ
ncbi:MAG: 2-amino-4-hydroxy-6-hydroxymethyldihydropteridine diphosphokinase [Planctomycetota bacterium]|nr:MAG: 2-amino-4-hydroxy-6-hydroxymethyldihydropteridine diphosphokinase [Planctomycetota bacterium]